MDKVSHLWPLEPLDAIIIFYYIQYTLNGFVLINN